MSRKTLSNGTLSLRFMQNAHRAKNLAEVEAERATVKDDGQWEVSQEVKQAWGLLNDVPSASSVTYETSYIPFLFSSHSPESSSPPRIKLRGRRTFNTSGQEVVEEPAAIIQEDEETKPRVDVQPDKPPKATSLPNSFLKPSGVDDPVAPIRRSGPRTISGTRTIKREREPASEQQEESRKKKKKKGVMG